MDSTLLSSKQMLLRCFFATFFVTSFFAVSSHPNATGTADSGGNRGWALSLAETDQYASVNGYFPAATFWPVNACTVSAWIRYTGISQTGRFRSFPLSLIANGDTNHFQPFINLVQVGDKISIANNAAGTAHNFVLPVALYNINYWAKMTFTYSSNGTNSQSNFYINGTLVSSWIDTGKVMRWSDSSTLVIGGYSSSSTGLSSKDRFLGWIDDLQFYNRILPPAEISSNWNKTGNVSDSSMFIYYDFEYSGSGLIKNKGTAGSTADLTNGEVFNGNLYYESITKQLRVPSKAYWVPGAPMQSIVHPDPRPTVVSLDVTSKLRIQLKCSNSAYTPSASSITGFTWKGGYLHQAPFAIVSPGAPVILGANISTFPAVITNSRSTVIYAASTVAVIDAFNYSMTCGGVVETGEVFVVVSSAAVADPTNVLTAIVNSSVVVYLHGLHGIAGLVIAEITTLPAVGTLYQTDLSNPSSKIRIIQVPTTITNPLLGLQYDCPFAVAGAVADTFGYKVYHDSIASAEALVQISIQSWNYPPVVPAATSVVVLDRQPKIVDLVAVDSTQKQFIGVYITALPTKGTLYQVLENGSKGYIIDHEYSAYLKNVPMYQYATKVLNVSSIWGKTYGADQTLGPQNCKGYGDCDQSWSPLTADGYGGMASGIYDRTIPVPGVTTEVGAFRNDPGDDFDDLGYTEYLELQYDEAVYVSELVIGENRGMGAVKNILAKDFLGNWMTLYTAIVDGTIQALYDKFAQYRLFRPSLCGSPFLTNHLRFEMDTRSVPDWNEWDFFKLGGSLLPDASAVRWNGLGTWQVIYVPDPSASGIDTFSYSANACPTNLQDWSPNNGVVTLNIVPTGLSGEVSVSRTKNSEINLSKWSVSTVSTDSLNFTITSLPSVGSLSVENETVSILPYTIDALNSKVMYTPDSSCKKQQTSFSYKSSDPNQLNALEVIIKVQCPRMCALSDLSYSISGCKNGRLGVTYIWNSTTVNEGNCAPGDQFPLPTPYLGIPCGYVPLSSPSGVVVIFFAVFVGVVASYFAIWLVVYRDTAVVKLSQLGHSAVYCIGGIWLQFSWMTYLGPVTPMHCMARPWLLGVSYSLMFGAFIRKIFIVMKVLESAQNISTKINSQKTNQRYSILTVMLVILIDAVIIIPWNLLSPSAPSGKTFKVPDIGDVTIDGYQCNSALTESFTLILVAYKVALTGVGAVIAFRVRSLHSIVGESTMMLYSTYNLIVSGILLLLISFIAVIDPATWLIVASAISCGAVTFSLCILFIPKVYIQYKQVSIVASDLFHSAASRHLDSYHTGRKRQELDSMIEKINSADKEKQEKDLSPVTMDKKMRRNDSSSGGMIPSISKLKPTLSEAKLVNASVSSL